MAMTVLVGRAGPLAALDAAVSDALTGVGHLVLISGEPGIGKSGLADEAAELAIGRGMPVARGYAIDDAGAPPLWPWRRLAADWPALRAAMTAPPDSADDPAARFQLFADITDEVRSIATTHGLLIILEDLHWADRSSLLLLRHVLTETSHARLLIIATFRETRIGPLPAVLPDLLRSSHSRTIRLDGIDAAAVAAWMARHPGLEQWADAAELVRDRTDGNPLLLRMLTDSLPTGGAVGRAELDDLLSRRSDVRALVTERLGTLTSGARELLSAASVVAERIVPDVLARVVDAASGAVDEWLTEAVAAGVLKSSFEGLSFTHALVRDAIYNELPEATRRSLHRRLAIALAATSRTPPAGSIARHWQQAAGSDAAASCVRWAQQAITEARSLLAHDEAVHFALLAIDMAEPAGTSPADRAQLWLELTQAQVAAGELGAGVASCQEAVRLAEQADRPDLMAAALLAVQGFGSIVLSRLIRRSIEQLLARLPVENSPTRARLLALLATAVAEDEGGAEAMRMSADALTVAEASGDALAILEALAARHLSIAIPATVEERVGLGRRAVSLGATSAHPMAAIWGHLWLVDAAFQLGDLDGVDREMSALDVIATTRRSPMARWHYERVAATRDALVGDFDAARAHNEASLALAQRMQDVSTFGMYHAFRAALGAVRGDPCEFPPIEAIRAAPAIPVVRITTPIYLAVNGEMDAARAAFDEFRPLPARIPVGTRWAGTLGQIGIAAVLLDDVEVAAEIYRLLLPTAHYCTNDGSGAVFCGGSTARALADLALTAGLFDEALRLYADSITVNSRLGARPFVALGRLGWARAVIAKTAGSPADLTLATRLAGQAADEFRRLDMPGPLRTADALRKQIALLAKSPDPLSRRESEVVELIVAGLPNREIAARLFLSERTVESHVRSVLAKLGLNRRTEIATWAVRRA